MKISKIMIFPLCLLLACVSMLQAQSLERQLISPYGHLSNTNDVDVSATAGELIVSTVSTTSITASQGFQQPNIEDFVGTFELSDLTMEVLVYPNPTSTYVNVELKSEEAVNVFLQLYDTKGKLVYNSPKIEVSGQTLKTIGFYGYPSGQYFLVVKDQEKKLLQSFKIQKH